MDYISGVSVQRKEPAHCKLQLLRKVIQFVQQRHGCTDPFCLVELIEQHLKDYLGVRIGAGYIVPTVEVEHLNAVTLNPDF